MNLANQLKNQLINRIEQIDDVNFLKAIQSLLDASNDGQVFQLSADQVKSINLSRQQIERGEEIKHADLMRNMDQWLKKK